MSDGRSTQRPPLFQATVTVAADKLEPLQVLQLDVVPYSTMTVDEVTTFEALLTPDQLEGVVAAGATVRIDRLVDQDMPPGSLATDREVARKLAPLEPYREDAGEEGAD